MRYQAFITSLFFFSSFTVFSQEVSVISPNDEIRASLCCEQSSQTGNWYLTINYEHDGRSCEAIPGIDLRISRSDQDFSKELNLVKTGQPRLINEEYTALPGKHAQCSNFATEATVTKKANTQFSRSRGVNEIRL